MRDLKSRADVDALFEAPEVVLLKHGATCVVSAGARTAVAAFEEERPQMPVVGIEVTRNRELSDYVTQRLGVPHQSPQLLVLRKGAVAWKAEHHDVTAHGIAKHVGK